MSTGALDTPLSSDIEASANLPPSPPLSPPKRASRTAVDRLTGTLKVHRRGKLENSGDWLPFSLSHSEYKQFEGRLRNESALRDWYREDVRAIDSLAEELEGSGGEEDGRIARELRKIYKGRSTTLELKVPRLEGSSQESGESEVGEKVVGRSPDATFYHPSQPDYPTLVVEVSYSQQQKDLPVLAGSYIIDSSHAICAVVGFKIPYSPPGAQGSQKLKANASPDKGANYSLWRPGLKYTGEEAEDGTRDTIGVCSQVEKDKRFRTSDSSQVRTSLDLQLIDLLPRILPARETMSASRQAMTQNKAEVAECASKETKKETTPATSRAPTKFRKRKRTPSEELSDGREETFLRQEMREREKDAQVDGEYVQRTRRVRKGKSIQGGIGAKEVGEVAIRGGDDAAAGASGHAVSMLMERGADVNAQGGDFSVKNE